MDKIELALDTVLDMVKDARQFDLMEMPLRLSAVRKSILLNIETLNWFIEINNGAFPDMAESSRRLVNQFNELLIVIDEVQSEYLDYYLGTQAA